MYIPKTISGNLSKYIATFSISFLYRALPNEDSCDGSMQYI